MSRNIEGQYLSIVKVSSLEVEGDQREERATIATIPVKTDVYNTPFGKIDLFVCPVGKDKTQKLIFSGPAIPTVQRRGQKGEDMRSGKRRVVDFPPAPKNMIPQPAGEGVVYEFGLVESLAAD